MSIGSLVGDPLANVFRRVFGRGEGAGAREASHAFARDAYRTGTRDALTAASRHFEAHKPLPRTPLVPAFSPELNRNEFLREVLQQWDDAGRQRGEALVRDAFNTPGYDASRRFMVRGQLAEELPRIHHHPSGGSAYIDFGSRDALAKDLMHQAERLQAGAVLGGPERYDQLFRQVYDGMGEALKQQDRQAYRRFMAALRPDLPTSSADCFYKMGYTNGGMAFVWNTTSDGLAKGLIGGDTAILDRLKPLLPR